jgi:hypothetical protein
MLASSQSILKFAVSGRKTRCMISIFSQNSNWTDY